MDRVAKINIEGHNYELIAGGAVEGTSASQASDWTKILVLPEGAALVDGVFLAITFTYGNTAGFAAPKTVYSDDGVSFFWDDQLTDAVTLPDPRNYTVTLVSGQEYSLIEYPVLYFQDQAFPVCNAKGYKCGGPLWGDGDTIAFLFIDHKFFMFLTAVTDQVQSGNMLPVTSNAVYDALQNVAMEIPVYATQADAQTDLPNLQVDQIVAVEEGDDGVIDAVVNGDLRAVTSNAVYDALKSLIKYKEVQISNITIGSGGYTNVASYKPSGMNTFLFALMYNYGTTSSNAALGINANGEYVYGTANSTITYMLVRYYYIDY